MTAAHCVVGKSTLGMEILVGTNIIKNAEKHGGKYYQAEHFKMHEDYNPTRLKRNGDIAVLRIIERFQFNERVQPIEMSPNDVPAGAQASEYNK